MPKNKRPGAVFAINLSDDDEENFSKEMDAVASSSESGEASGGSGSDQDSEQVVNFKSKPKASGDIDSYLVSAFSLSLKH